MTQLQIPRNGLELLVGQVSQMRCMHSEWLLHTDRSIPKPKQTSQIITSYLILSHPHIAQIFSASVTVLIVTSVSAPLSPISVSSSSHCGGNHFKTSSNTQVLSALEDALVIQFPSRDKTSCHVGLWGWVVGVLTWLHLDITVLADWT